MEKSLQASSLMENSEVSKQLWIIVGGNGAGKSTFYDKALKPLGIPFINADNLAREFFSDDPEKNSYLAAKLAERMRENAVQENKTFCFETVFSHPSKIDFLARCKAAGYKIIMVVVHVENIQLNQARVSQRVASGGHSVPAQKIIDRVPRMLANVRSAIPLCDEVYLIDNSSIKRPLDVVATITNGVVNQKSGIPVWARSLLC